jgi:hypothetical protein
MGPRTGVSGLGAAPPAAHPAGPVTVGPFFGTWAAELEICDESEEDVTDFCVTGSEV